MPVSHSCYWRRSSPRQTGVGGPTLLRMPLRAQRQHWPLPMRPAMRRHRLYFKECADPQSKAMRYKNLDPHLRHQPLYQLRLQLAVHTGEVTVRCTTRGDHEEATTAEQQEILREVEFKIDDLCDEALKKMAVLGWQLGEILHPCRKEGKTQFSRCGRHHFRGKRVPLSLKNAGNDQIFTPGSGASWES